MPATAIRVPLVRIRLGRLDDERLAALAGAGDERAFEVALRPPSSRAARLLPALAPLARRGRGCAPADLPAGAPRAADPRRTRRAAPVAVHDRPQPLQHAARARRPDAGRRRSRAVPPRGWRRRRAPRRPPGAARRRRAAARRTSASALVLAELADLPHSEIAAVIGVPDGEGQGARAPGTHPADRRARGARHAVRGGPRGARDRPRRRVPARAAPPPPAWLRALPRLPGRGRGAAHGARPPAPRAARAPGSRRRSSARPPAAAAAPRPVGASGRRCAVAAAGGIAAKLAVVAALAGGPEEALCWP